MVDAAQGVEAQTLANVYLAMENELEIIVVLNKVDLPGAPARPDQAALRAHNSHCGRSSRHPPTLALIVHTGSVRGALHAAGQ